MHEWRDGCCSKSRLFVDLICCMFGTCSFMEMTAAMVCFTLLRLLKCTRRRKRDYSCWLNNYYSHALPIESVCTEKWCRALFGCTHQPSGFFPPSLHQMARNPTVQNRLDQRAQVESGPSTMGTLYFVHFLTMFLAFCVGKWCQRCLNISVGKTYVGFDHPDGSMHSAH